MIKGKIEVTALLFPAGQVITIEKPAIVTSGAVTPFMPGPVAVGDSEQHNPRLRPLKGLELRIERFNRLEFSNAQRTSPEIGVASH